MRHYLYEDFAKHNPEAVLLARRKLHPKLDDNCVMSIYAYDYRKRTYYMLRYREYMVTNPLTFTIPIPQHAMLLFCYEWFAEYERITGVVEMFEEDNDFYSTPNHLNGWEFETRWQSLYGEHSALDYRHFSSREGEMVRTYKTKQVYRHLDDLKKYGTKEELADLQKELEAYIHALSSR